MSSVQLMKMIVPNVSASDIFQPILLNRIILYLLHIGVNLNQRTLTKKMSD